MPGGTAHGQAVLRKDLKKDFGAAGDGKTNDQAAFQRAAAFFNQRAATPAGAGPAELRIPKGVYLVGRQDSTGKGGNVLLLNNCRNLKVLGDDSATTEIRYAAGLRYGAFDPATRLPYEAPTAYFVDRSYAATVETCIALLGCENVEVAGLNLNGNSPHLLVGGHWGDTGIQLGFDGVFITGSRRIRLRGLAIHHFGRDGMQVLNGRAKSLDDPSRDDIVLENSTCDYNGRQGLSLTGVNGFRATNCSFSHTGRVPVAATGKPLFSNPGAGIDLEPQDNFVTNVRLDNCRFVDNAGQGIVSDRPGNDRPATVGHVVATGCLLWGTSNWSAWVTQPGFLFRNCRIYGAFIHGCQASTPAEATRFVGCTFEDRPYRGQPAYGPATLYSDSVARRMSFSRCRFVGTRSYLVQARPAARDTADWFHFRSCTFLLDYARPPLGAANTLAGAVLSGTTVVRDGQPLASRPPTDFVLGSAAAGLRVAGRLELLAPACRHAVPGGLVIGGAAGRGVAAQVVVGADNALAIAEAPAEKAALYIGPHARLVIKKGGALELLSNARIVVAGQLVVEDGAYFFRHPQARVRLVGPGRLRVARQAIKAKHPTLHSS
ncbi:hypothetical protein GCM10027345_18040 [Hymenobacter daeguensis]